MTYPNYPKCNHCGQELFTNEQCDMEFDSSYATLYCVGTCPKCKTTYQWIEDYDVTYEGFRELIETERS